MPQQWRTHAKLSSLRTHEKQAGKVHVWIQHVSDLVLHTGSEQSFMVHKCLVQNLVSEGLNSFSKYSGTRGTEQFLNWHTDTCAAIVS